MTDVEDSALPAQLLKQVSAQASDLLPESIRVIPNMAVQIELTEYLNSEPDQYTGEPKGHAGANKPKRLRTRCVRLSTSL